jgi:hypothetical protein
MKIAFDVNGVLRDTFGKMEQVYQKFMIDDYIKEEGEEDFEYKLNLPVTSYNLLNHFIFKEKDDLYQFLYVDYPMNIFGHAPSISANTFNVMNEIYEELRDEHDIYIISEEIQKSKPATLFFLSKYGVLVENIIFYSKFTEEEVLKNFDVVVTANPELIEKDIDLKIVKYKTTYNENLTSEFEIETLSDFKELYEKLKLKSNVQDIE